MQSGHRRFIRRGNNHPNNFLDLPPVVPPVVTSILSQIFGGGNQPTTTAINPPAQSQAPAPQTTSPGVGDGDSGISSGGNSQSSNGNGSGNNGLSSPNPSTPTRTQPAGVPVGSGTATDAASIAAQSQATAAGVGSNARDHPNSSGSTYGQPGTPSNNPGIGGTSLPSPIAGSGGSGSTGGSGSAATHPHLSPSAVFAISFLSLLFIAAVIIFVLRRRNSLRRNRRKQLWFGVDRILGFRLSTGSEHATFGSGTQSARSSFATNIDHGLTPVASQAEFQPPAIPPMAEIRQSVNRAEVQVEILVNVETGSNRSSVSSSYSGTQYALVPGESDHNLANSMPMIVSPFTPTEHFAFPHPPSRPTTAERETSIAEDANASSLWLNRSPSPPPVVEMPAPAFLAGANRLQSVPPSPTYIPPRGTTANPFADPREDNSEEGKLETVRRVFSPTLGDELAVAPGDQVIVQKVFDDGWAYVDKGDAKGLIPIDCLRKTGQDISAFLALQRVDNSCGSAV